MLPNRPFTRPETLLSAAVLLAAVIYCPLLVGAEYQRGYDASTHIFFSQGYVQNWWTDWDVRWYGGFSRYLYPPLAHQLVALITMAGLDVHIAYEIVAWSFIVIWPLAIYVFARIFVAPLPASLAALLAVFLPALRSSVFVFGQFAGFAGLVFALLSAGCLSVYLFRGGKLVLISTVSFAACCICTHHNTAIYFLPAVLLTAIVVPLLSASQKLHILKRGGTALAAIVLSGLIVMLPFWKSLTTIQMQVPIPHASRNNFLLDSIAVKYFLIDLYGPLLLFLPAAMLFLRRFNTAIRLLFGLFLLYALLGLGGTTPFPSWLFHNWWAWLTYERFAVWAAVLLLVLGVAFIDRSRLFAEALASVLIVALLMLVTLTWLAAPQIFRSTPAPVQMEPVVQAFEDYPSCSSRFLALGFSYQLPEFSVVGHGYTLDGLWHTARSDRLLRSSGVGSLGDALQWANGRTILNNFLMRQSPVPANCILVNETSSSAADYRSIITQVGWKEVRTYSNSISLWMPRISPSGQLLFFQLPHLPNSNSRILNTMWGVLPILGFIIASTSFLACGILYAYETRRNYSLPSES